MWSKFVKEQPKATQGTQQTETLYETKPLPTQTTELLQTKLGMGMGLPFNTMGNRRRMPWQSEASMHFHSATLSPLMPLGTQ
mmetsp:Transcript_47569/g.74294  ORF Transcript_47569/g.74294 Transcript_47569/m.74294 type:complete len:82 (-) Transcript_47569:198-443(-)